MILSCVESVLKADPKTRLGRSRGEMKKGAYDAIAALEQSLVWSCWSPACWPCSSGMADCRRCRQALRLHNCTWSASVPGDRGSRHDPGMNVMKKADVLFCSDRIKEKFPAELQGKEVIGGYWRLFPYYGQDPA